MNHGLKALIDSVLPEVIRYRHELHKIPELAGREELTAKFIRKKLSYLPLKVFPPRLGTDTVADLQTGRPGKNFVLRADMDALPMTESTGKSYASLHAGCMHGCGHDGHMAILLGAATVLCRFREELNGNIRFVWQPGEENAAMGRTLVARGVLDEPKADFVTALHGMPGLPAKTFSFRPGAMLAACSHWKLKITGRGAHGSMPEEAVDPIYLGSIAVQKIHHIAGELFSKQDKVVISVGKFTAGKSDNVIPDSAEIVGTARFFDTEHGRILENGLRDFLNELVLEHHAGYDLEFDTQYIPLINDENAAKFAAGTVRKYMQFIPMKQLSMIAEDFAYYLAERPGVFALMGLGENMPLLHSSGFDFPDECLADGVHYFCRLVLEGQKNLK